MCKENLPGNRLVVVRINFKVMQLAGTVIGLCSSRIVYNVMYQRVLFYLLSLGTWLTEWVRPTYKEC